MPQDQEQQHAAVRRWVDVDKQEQTQLLIDYGHYQDRLQTTCDIETKNRRFTRWLAQRSIQYL